MIKPISALTPKVFKGQSSGFGNVSYENPTKKRIALVNAGGISAVAGAATTIFSRSYTSSWRHAGLIGAGAAAITMMFLAPRFLYKAGFNTNTKAKEIDTFAKDVKIPRKLLHR